ncbi:diacylglycerol kinase, partial [Pseudomonas aeruginosa]
LLNVVLIPVAFLLDVSRGERALMIAACLLALIVELLNSAIEATVDRVSLERHPLSKNAEMLAAAGLEHPSQLEAKHLVRRITDTEIRLFSQLHYFLKPGELLSGKIEGEFYERMWNMARADSFDAAA